MAQGLMKIYSFKLAEYCVACVSGNMIIEVSSDFESAASPNSAISATKVYHSHTYFITNDFPSGLQNQDFSRLRSAGSSRVLRLLPIPPFRHAQYRHLGVLFLSFRTCLPRRTKFVRGSGIQSPLLPCTRAPLLSLVRVKDYTRKTPYVNKIT